MDGAKLIISGDSEKALNYLKGDVKEIQTSELPEVDKLITSLASEYKTDDMAKPFNIPVSDFSSVLKQIDEYFDLFASFTVLTPSKKGLFGTYSLNTMIKKGFNPGYKPFYHGEPIMITRNDYINGLFNGDRGVILSFTNGLYAFFKELETTFFLLKASHILVYIGLLGPLLEKTLFLTKVVAIIS